MLASFETRRIRTSDTEIFLRLAGSGPPVLLLHGYPQTNVMWHRIAPRLARDFTVVCPDLRGYGDSGKPPSDPEHLAYSKRSMAGDMAGVMEALGFPTFAVAGHDRGARVTHRLCLDHPGRVTRAALLDIAPTRTVFRNVNKALATSYFHWFFMIQPEPLPERMIGAEPIFWLHAMLGGMWGTGLDHFAPETLAEYERCFDATTIHATCEDYRAAASVDLVHDEADLDRKIECPLLALWGERGVMHRNFDVLATWRERAAGPVEGGPLPCGHFLAEEAPEETFHALQGFFAGELRDR